MPDPKLYCGTSGFAYRQWEPDFYPHKLAATEFLAYYATRLNAVEVNWANRSASATKLQHWVKSTPNGFLFLPKARIKLDGAEEFTSVFLESLEPLRAARRLGPILFQIGSNYKADSHQLRRFLNLLPKDFQTALEFRNPTWFDESIYNVLRNANVALCITESEDLETPWVLTADFVYMRLRKPEYLQSRLISIQYRVEQYLGNAYPTFAIFKGGRSAAGALNAEKLFVTQKTMGTAK